MYNSNLNNRLQAGGTLATDNHHKKCSGRQVYFFVEEVRCLYSVGNVWPLGQEGVSLSYTDTLLKL